MPSQPSPDRVSSSTQTEHSGIQDLEKGSTDTPSQKLGFLWVKAQLYNPNVSNLTLCNLVRLVQSNRVTLKDAKSLIRDLTA